MEMDSGDDDAGSGGDAAEVFAARRKRDAAMRKAAAAGPKGAEAGADWGGTNSTCAVGWQQGRAARGLNVGGRPLLMV